jgi:hypothetical protein
LTSVFKEKNQFLVAEQQKSRFLIIFFLVDGRIGSRSQIRISTKKNNYRSGSRRPKNIQILQIRNIVGLKRIFFWIETTKRVGDKE